MSEVASVNDSTSTSSLDPNIPPEEYIMISIIYRVKSSGNIVEHAIRDTVKHSKEEYPEAYDAVVKDTYVDDCLSGAADDELVPQKAENMQTSIKG